MIDDLRLLLRDWYLLALVLTIAAGIGIGIWGVYEVLRPRAVVPAAWGRIPPAALTLDPSPFTPQQRIDQAFDAIRRGR